VNAAEWNALLEETLRDLPAALRERIGEVQFRIARVPSAEQRDLMADCDDCGLLGLYEGVALPDRFEGDEPLVPDRITIFTLAHETEFRGGAALEQGVRDTIVHEIGHYLGLDDDDLDALGLG
jgi:predicted Zn-dependent protease with MMP-like domain